MNWPNVIQPFLLGRACCVSLAQRVLWASVFIDQLSYQDPDTSRNFSLLVGMDGAWPSPNCPPQSLSSPVRPASGNTMMLYPMNTTGECFHKLEKA
jgi:hypothetical protein